ncbi:autotransporter domain-containing protein [Paraburkholderia acidiphila]|nr:autotransporter domain-containing protein [Paraburkholderia acidiphila]
MTFALPGLASAAAPPSVTSINPTSGPTGGGTSVTITGTSFTGASAVYFGGTAATSFTVVSATQIVAMSPAAAAGTVDITVTTTLGTSTTGPGDQFAYIAAPTAGAVNLTVAYGSQSNPVTLNLGGGAATSVAVASAASHGTATASGTSITYTPQSGYAGTDSFTYTASNDSGTSASATVVVTITPPTLSISPAGLTAPTVGTAYSQTIVAGGGYAPYTYSIVSGSLPAGLTLNASTGVLSGTPTAAGPASFMVAAKDSSTGTGPFTGTLNYAVTVNPSPLTLTPSTLPAGTYGTPYMQTLTASGGAAPYTYAVVAGTLPPGLLLTSSGVLIGTPTATGTANFTVQATASNALVGSQSYSLTINSIAPVAGAVTANVAYNSSGGNTIALNLSGGTAASVAVVAAPSHGTAVASGTSITYTPATGYSGPDSFTYTATNSGGTSAPATVTITVGAPTLSITPATLTAPTVGVAYSQTLTASGGNAPYTYSVAAGALPAGLSLNAATGVLSGTPAAAGTSSFTVAAKDSSTGTGAVTAQRAYTLTVNASTAVPAAPAVTVTTQSNAAVTIHATASASGGPFTAVAIASAPKTGTAVVNGLDIVYTPASTSSGEVGFTYTIANSAGVSAPIAVTVTVNAVPVALAQRQVSTSATQSVSVDITDGATGGPFMGAAIISVSPAAAGTASIVGGANGSVMARAAVASQSGALAVRFVPAAAFAGTATITYTLSNAIATSAPGVLLVTVAARPDPSTDPDVVGLIDAQVEAARRFANAQIANYSRRLERLHGTGHAPSSNDLSVALPGKAPSAGAQCEDAASPTLRDACVRANQALEASSSSSNDSGRPGHSGLAADGRDRAANAASDLAFWSAGSVDFGMNYAGNQRSGFRFTTPGVTAGMDYRISEHFSIGAGFGYGHDSSDIGSDGTKSTGDSYSFALYGSYRPQPSLFVDGIAGFGTLSFNSRRWDTGAGDFASGQRDGRQKFASLAAGYEHRSNTWLISPYGRIAYADATLDQYSESGAGIDSLTYFGQTVTTVSGALGLRAEYAQATRWGVLLPYARVEYQHDFNGQGTASLAYADLAGAGPAYFVSTVPSSQNRMQVEVGSRFQMRSITFGLDYSVMFGNNSFMQGVRLSVSAPW